MDDETEPVVVKTPLVTKDEKDASTLPWPVGIFINRKIPFLIEYYRMCC